MSFEVTPGDASNAIIECARIVLEHAPQIGHQEVLEHGSGIWATVGTSSYFNCGCNKYEHTPPGTGDYGTLTLEHLQGLENWFTGRYPGYTPNVLKANANRKWNFTLVHGTSALNFHMEKQDHY
jgi:hypothetical protein